VGGFLFIEEEKETAANLIRGGDFSDTFWIFLSCFELQNIQHNQILNKTS